MRWLCAGLAYVNFATVAALVFGTAFRGLSATTAALALVCGFAGAVAAFVATDEPSTATKSLPEVEKSSRSKRRSRRREVILRPRDARYSSFWLWVTIFCFAVFALRSFCWLLYIDGNELKVQSPNNLGDLALHLTYINQFASGVPLWPDNPIFVFSKLRYPAGTDLFNSLFTCLGISNVRALVWAGLLGCGATCYALYRWAGTFGIAAFLFNGGVAGFQVLQSGVFLDYQGDKSIAWKSLSLSMLVTQRGLLYAIPVGVLLLYHWQRKFYGGNNNDAAGKVVAIPLWLELTFYASMPLFHVHTFLCLSIVLLVMFAFGPSNIRKETALLVGLAVVPATLFVWIVSDHFKASSILGWQLGWVEGDGDFKMPAVLFWLANFGAWVPAIIALFVIIAAREAALWKKGRFLPSSTVVFLSAAAVILVFSLSVKLAPWGWDNIKVIVWAYLLVLPFLWNGLIKPWSLPLRVVACIALFGSGFVSLVGGLAAGREGFAIANRGELDGVGVAVRKLALDARYAAFPTYNHPVLMQGREAVMGYPGHLWTQGFGDYADVEEKLTLLMNGASNWREIAESLDARYIFWGEQETTNYATSTRPWEVKLAPVASGSWGAIYDLHSPTTIRK